MVGWSPSKTGTKIVFSLCSIVKQAIFAYVNHARICSWDQPVLNN